LSLRLIDVHHQLGLIGGLLLLLLPLAAWAACRGSIPGRAGRFEEWHPVDCSVAKAAGQLQNTRLPRMRVKSRLVTSMPMWRTSCSG